VIGATAAARGGGPAQVLIAWHLQIGISTIPESVNPAQLRENLAAAELTLTPADLAQIAGLDQHLRLVDGSFWLLEGSPWKLQILWDEG
jgi:alcohol dehydrogenase (NADP+)